MSINVQNLIKQHGFGVVMAGLLLLFTLRVQAIGDGRYVSKEQFQAWVDAHQRENNQILIRLSEQHDQEVASIKELKDEIKLLRQELKDRRPPPRFPQNQDTP